MNEFFDKEEWASRKQQDRESAYAMVDDALKKVGTDGKAFQTYLMSTDQPKIYCATRHFRQSVL